MRLFARARDLAGTDGVSVTVPAPATVAHVRSALISCYPPLHAVARSLLAAVDSEYAGEERVLNAGNEVAFFPPVSGG